MSVLRETAGPYVNATVLAFTGSRDHPNTGLVIAHLAEYIILNITGPVIIRHGACPGEYSADQAVHDWITTYGLPMNIIADPMPADWDQCAPECPVTPTHRRRKKPGDTAHPGLARDYCPGAGPRRNRRMLTKPPTPKALIAAPYGASYGTRGCMRLAENLGIHVERILL
jgi:hypothetical protein